MCTKSHSPLARFKLFSDYFRFNNPSSLTKATDFNITHLFDNVTVLDALEFTRYLDKEDDLLVWTKVLGILPVTLSPDSEDEYRPKFPPVKHLHEYMRPKYSSVLQSIDIPSITLHSSDQIQLEAWTMLHACEDGSPVCEEKGKQLLNQWKADPEFLSFYSFNEVVFMPFLVMNIIQGGGKEGFDFVAEQFFAGRNVTAIRPSIDGEILIELLMGSHDKESLKLLLTNLTAEAVTDDNPFALGRMDNPFIYFIDIPRWTSTSFASVELYRNFFYEHCARIESTFSSFQAKRDKATSSNTEAGFSNYEAYLDQIGITHFFPKIFAREQFHELLDFVDSDPRPQCIGSDWMGTVSKKLLKSYSQVRSHEEWMKSTGNQIYSWFENNK